MSIIYLSPHFDDVSLSCGGLIWDQTQASDSVEVWTICAGDPPNERLSTFAKELHQRWGLEYDAVALRREEDIQSCHILGTKYRHFDIPDAIYRLHPKSKEYLYDSGETIMGDLASSEQSLIRRLATQISDHLPPNALLISPLSIGNHVDHQLTRKAAEMLEVSLVFYADYPYIKEHTSNFHTLLPQDYQPNIYAVSQDGLTAWQESIAAHTSQISTFWENVYQMQEAINKYHREVGGIVLWKYVENSDEKPQENF
jgi:LmbE family N-acetylglucosaminyl deacetylase